MTSPRRRLRAEAGRWTAGGVVVGALMVATTAVAASGAVALLYERTVMTAADSRCALFDQFPFTHHMESG
ncbi:MAG: hypothetical protein V4466_10545, partial [Pseudomonadota bacterium]